MKMSWLLSDPKPGIIDTDASWNEGLIHSRWFQSLLSMFYHCTHRLLERVSDPKDRILLTIIAFFLAQMCRYLNFCNLLNSSSKFNVILDNGLIIQWMVPDVWFPILDSVVDDFSESMSWCDPELLEIVCKLWLSDPRAIFSFKFKYP